MSIVKYYLISSYILGLILTLIMIYDIRKNNPTKHYNFMDSEVLLPSIFFIFSFMSSFPMLIYLIIAHSRAFIINKYNAYKHRKQIKKNCYKIDIILNKYFRSKNE